MSLSSDTKQIAKLPPKEAIEYLRQKGYKLTFNYKELMHQAHHKAFTVAKIQRLDLLSDIKESIIKAQKEGKSFYEWKRSIKPTLIKKGWWGEVEAINRQTGEIKTITVNTHRLKTIFYTNTRVAYQVQKAKKIYSDKNIKYLRYSAILDSSTRKSHRRLHGTILPKDDEWWRTHFPPNGWNCRCKVVAIPPHKTPKITDKSTLPKDAVEPDWAYDIQDGGFFDRYKGGKIEEQANSSYKDFNLPDAKEIKEQNLPSAPPRYKDIKDKKEALEILKQEILGGKKEATIRTPITDILFDEKKLEHIIKKDIRAEFAKYILPTLTEPDEVWAVRFKTEDDKYFKKRYRYIKLFKEKKENTLAVSELLRDGSVFVTFIKINKPSQIDKQRVGILMYFNSIVFGE